MDCGHRHTSSRMLVIINLSCHLGKKKRICHSEGALFRDRHLHRTAFPDTVRQDGCGAVQVRVSFNVVEILRRSASQNDM
jgi:hypothetical protein